MNFLFADIEFFCDLDEKKRKNEVNKKN